MDRLRKEILFYRFTLALLLVGGVLFYLFNGGLLREKAPPNNTIAARKDAPPFYSQIMELIRPLRYSGFQTLIRPDVELQLDFQKMAWRIHNMHHFDAQGNVLLAESRYGLCGELAASIIDKVKLILGDAYMVRFARVCESGYFLNPQASHIMLIITTREVPGKKTYILDPSFQRYEAEEDAEEYLFFEVNDKLTFVQNRNSDEAFNVEQGTPILIHKDFLISLGVEKSDGNFDKNNFSIVLNATKRYKYSGRCIFALRNNNGKAEFFEDKTLAGEILDQQEYRLLRDKLIRSFDKLYNTTNSLYK